MKHRVLHWMVAVVTLFALAGGLALAQDDPPRPRRERTEANIPLERLLRSGAVDVEVVRTDNGVKLSLTSDRPAVVEQLQRHARRWQSAHRRREGGPEAADRPAMRRREREAEAHKKPEAVEERLRQRRRRMLREQQEARERRPREREDQPMHGRAGRPERDVAPRKEGRPEQKKRELPRQRMQEWRGRQEERPGRMERPHAYGDRPMLREWRRRPFRGEGLPRFDRPGLRGRGGRQPGLSRFRPARRGAGRWGALQRGPGYGPGLRGRGLGHGLRGPRQAPFRGRGRFGPPLWAGPHAGMGHAPGYGPCPGPEECPHHQAPGGPHTGARGR